MKREKNYKTAKFIEALEHIDPKYVEEAGKKIKERPMGQTVASMSRAKSLRQVLALVACVLLLSAVIPAVTYLVGHLPDIIGSSTGDDTTEQTSPETPPEETSSPAPETTVTETMIEETTAEETTSEPETTECTHSEYICTENIPTCTESAIIEYGCMLCGHSWSKTEPPLGHEFKDGVCTRCGEKEPITDGSQGLEYSIGGNAEIGRYATLEGIGTCTDVDIVVASYYKGYPVKYIEQSAFYGQTQINSIRLSDTVERIGYQAFRNCTSLEGIYIGSGLRELFSHAFWGCGNITKIEIDPDNKYFEGVNCIIEKSRKALVFGCRTTVIPDDGSVTRIDGLAFKDVIGLTSITIPEGVTTLGEDAFSGCPDLGSIHFSSTVDSFELVSVMGCDALEVITVDPKNPRFYSSGNCVIEKETGALLLGCAGSVIPNDGSVKRIGYYAFGSNDSLTSITIPEGVTDLDGYAFAGCAGLREIILPDSVTTVSFGVFMSCTSLERFEFSENTKTIGSFVFDGCTNLREVKMPTYATMGEAVFMDCSSLESITIPTGQDILHIGTLSACINLKSVVLPDTLTQIQSSFTECFALESITIPAGVTIIDHEAFLMCTSLTEFNFKGTMAEWKAVTKENGWNRGCPFTVVHCSDGEVALSLPTDYNET